MIILKYLSTDYNLRIRFTFTRHIVQTNRYSQSTLERVLRRVRHHDESINTPPTQQAQPPVTPRTRRRAETRNANNVLTESPNRRRRRPIAPAEPAEPPPPPPPPPR